MKRLIFTLFFLVFSVTVSAQETISSAIQPKIDEGTFPGLVSVFADKDGNVSINSVGWANIEEKIPMSGDRVFWIASMSKGITAAALMILVDEGKVDLDAPLETYLPEFQHFKVAELVSGENLEAGDSVYTLRPPKSPVTVRQVMSHMSGLPFITSLMKDFKRIDILPPLELSSTIARTPLITEPGTAFNYSNLGIDVGGAIIEKVSGVPFETFLKERIFDPLEMKDTVFWLSEEQLSRLVETYRVGDGPCKREQIDCLLYPFTDHVHRYAEGGGGLFSTPQDIIKFYQMLAHHGVYQGKRILSEEAIQTLATKQTPDDIDFGYSLGLWVKGNWVWHGGAQQTEGVANLKTGEARVYMVQLVGTPDPEIRKKVDQIINSWSLEPLDK